MHNPSTATPPWYREISGTQWKSFFAAWVGYALDGFDFVLITLVLTEISDDFDLSSVEGASLVSAAFITRWIGGAALGAMGDRYGRKLSMIVSILLYSLGTVACGFAWDYSSLFVARLAIGMGMAGEYSASATYAMESWPAHLRNRASGFLISGYSVGTVLAGQLYQYIVPNLGWRWMFYIGIIPILVALWLRRSLPEAQEWTETVQEMDRKPNPFGALFTSPRRSVVNTVLTVVATLALFGAFTPLGADAVPVLSVLAGASLLVLAAQFGGRRQWLLYVGMTITVFFAFLYTWPLQALLPTYLKTELDFTPGEVSDALFFAGFGTIVGCCLAGFLGDWLGTKRAYSLILLVSLIPVFPVFAVGNNFWALAALLFVLQALSFGVSSLLPRYIGGHFPTDNRAAALGFTYNVGALGGAVAPVLGTSLASGMSLGTSLAVLTFAGTLLVVLLVAFDVPARLHRVTDPEGAKDHLAPEAVEDAVPAQPTKSS